MRRIVNEDAGGATTGNTTKDAESQVIGQLDKSAKMDDIDTVTFGLETDDGKIVKVYVDAEQGDDFEKALSDKLGEVDDIETALNDLSRDFEIVDVEWPDDDSGDEGSDEGDDVEDGSDALNASVYANKKEASAKTVRPKMESNRAKTRFRDTLSEATVYHHHHTHTAGSIESRMVTPMQQLIYHTIIELGVPEIALEKSPYKSSIVAGIKGKASELNKFPTLKAALKIFIRRVHGLEDEEDLKEGRDVGEYIAESVAEDFWDCVTKIIKYLSPDEKRAEEFLGTTKFKTLVSRSIEAIPENVKSDLRMKMQKLSDGLAATDAKAAMLNKPKVVESVSPEVATEMFSDLFTLVDPTPSKTVSKTLLNSPEFRQFFMLIKPHLSQKFTGIISQKFIDFVRALRTNLSMVEKPTGPSQPTVPGQPPQSGQPGQPGARSAGAAQPAVESSRRPGKVLVESSDWEFQVDDGNAVASTGSFKMALDQEQMEKAAKAISSKNVVVVSDALDEKKKYTLSPRGINVEVKSVGDDTAYKMNADQVSDFLDLVAKGGVE